MGARVRNFLNHFLNIFQKNFRKSGSRLHDYEQENPSSRSAHVLVFGEFLIFDFRFLKNLHQTAQFYAIKRCYMYVSYSLNWWIYPVLMLSNVLISLLKFKIRFQSIRKKDEGVAALLWLNLILMNENLNYLNISEDQTSEPAAYQFQGT